jgi:hypothetical protein
MFIHSVVGLLLNFVGLWFLIKITYPKKTLDIKPIALLAVLLTIFALIGSLMGFLGDLAAVGLSLVAIMKILQYDLFKAFLFSIALAVIQFAAALVIF